MKIIAIVAVSENGIIGKNGQLPWHPIPEDFRRVKEATTGHAVIMGAKTAKSLLDIGKFPLPGRKNYVISTSMPYQNPWAGKFELRRRIENAIGDCKFYRWNAYLIGGERIYREGLQYCDTVFLTRVHETVEYGPDDVVARFDGLAQFENLSSTAWQCDFIGQTSDGRASFYKYTRVR